MLWTSLGYSTSSGPKGSCAGKLQCVRICSVSCLVLIRPLHGVPILIKDNIATMDKMNNTGNSNSESPAQHVLMKSSGVICFDGGHCDTRGNGDHKVTCCWCYHLGQDNYGRVGAV